MRQSIFFTFLREGKGFHFLNLRYGQPYRQTAKVCVFVSVYAWVFCVSVYLSYFPLPYSGIFFFCV